METIMNILADEILKRLNTLENCLFKMVDVIDLARNFDQRVSKLEREMLKIECDSFKITGIEKELETLHNRIDQVIQHVKGLKHEQLVVFNNTPNCCQHDDGMIMNSTSSL
jgi:hypothetical protein